MKKNLLIRNLLTIALFFSMQSFAQTYKVSSTDNEGTNADIYIDTMHDISAPELKVFETVGGILPANTPSFMPVTDAKGITLDWATTIETQNKGWYIERSPALNSNISWLEIGFVNGSGNSSIINKYSFLDNTVLSGIWFYRLKQVDENGNIAYSNVILAKINLGEKNIQLNGYPNPFRSSSTIHFTVPAQSKVSLQLYTMEGKLVNTLLQEDMKAGIYEQVLNDQILATGKYILKLNVDNQTITTVMIKTL